MNQAALNWNTFCNDPLLRNLPYKIQTDHWGNILMSPATNEHGMYQAKIVALISKLTDTGTIIVECSFQTPKGVKVADVAYASDEFIKKHKGQNPFDEAPEICIEIISPSNTEAEINEKKALYFGQGAHEFWICDLDGNITIYKNAKLGNADNIIVRFPMKIFI